MAAMPWMELACVDDGIPDVTQFFTNWAVNLTDGRMAFPTGGSGWGVTLRTSAALSRRCTGVCAPVA